MKLISLMPNSALIFIFLIISGILFLLFPLLKEKKTKIKTAFLLFFVPLFGGSALLLYAHWGQSAKVLDLLAIQTISEKIATLNETSKEEILSDFVLLENSIEYSAIGLATLANLYNEIGLFDKAIVSLEKAMALKPKETDYREQWIVNHSLSNQGKLPEEIRENAIKLIKAEPTRYSLVNLIAIDDYFHEKYPEAIARWHWLLNTDKALTPERRAALQSAIASAHKHQGTDTAALAPTFKVKVSINQSLLSSMPKDAKVFVFVKNANQSGPPLVALKKSVVELPFSVDLGDEHAMMGQKLAVGTEVQVIAKIALSGDPLAKQGDRQGIHKTMIKPGINHVDITIL